MYIEPHLGYGTRHTLFVHGRVLKRPPPRPTRRGGITNAINLLRTFFTPRAKQVPVTIQYQSQRIHTHTDARGYFTATITLDQPLPRTEQWYTVLIHTPEMMHSTLGFVLVDVSENEYGIISDIDDTILIAHATNFRRLLALTFMHPFTKRRVFANTALAFQHFRNGASGSATNPFFYVSSSPRPLYPFLHTFLATHKLPEGPILLRPLDHLWRKLWSKRGHEHKREKIAHILATYPERSFILIGDNGQFDVSLYTTLANQFPKQIQAIYIRDVSGTRKIHTPACAAPCIVAAHTRDWIDDAYSRGLIKKPLATESTESDHRPN